MRLMIFLCLFIISSLNATVYINDYRDFKLINPDATRNITGDFTIIGNTVEAVTKCKRITSLNEIKYCEIATDNNVKYFDNYYLTKFFNADKSSIAYLKLPKNAKKVIWAAVVWQGHLNNYTYKKSNTNNTYYGWDYYYMRSFDVQNINGKRYVFFHYWRRSKSSYYYQLSNDLPGNKPSGIKQTDANKIKLSINNTTYSLEADKLFYKGDTRYFCNLKGYWCGYDLSDYKKKRGVKYSAYKVLNNEQLQTINDNIKYAKNGNGIPVKVEDLKSTWGLEARLGDYGAWTLVVIYEADPSSESSVFQSINIYTGFKSLPRGNIHDLTINVNKLLLPKHGPIKSKLAVFTAEGEKSLGGDPKHGKTDSMKLNNYILKENNSDKYNIFDSYISNEIKREPQLNNNNGIDIDIFDASKAMENLRDNNPNTDFHTAKIQVHSYPDGIFIGLITFATQLYKPNICYLEQLYDSAGNMLQPGDTVRVGDTIKVRVHILNEDNQTAEKVKFIRYFDDNTTVYQYNSTHVQNVGWQSARYIADNSSYNNTHVDYLDENRTLQVWYLGKGSDYIFEPYGESEDNATIEFNAIIVNDLNVSFNYNVSYAYRIGDITFNYSGNLPQCIDFNNTIVPYRPPLGSFNVVHGGFTGNYDPTDPSDSRNALKTAVVKKNYSFKVLHLGNDLEHLAPITGVVFLDVVDATNIDNTQQSCVNAPIVYKLPGKSDFVNFGLNDASKSSSVSMTSKILKIAKNATFRVRYIDWPTVLNERHIPCVDISAQNGNLKGVPQCLNSSTKIAQAFPDTPCIRSSTGAPCNPSHHGVGNPPYDHQFGCIQCLTDHHAFFACARDNFAIRPYGFVTFADNYLKRSGENINITIKAVDEGNFTLSTGNKNSVIGLADYNESISNLDLNATIYTPTPAEIRQMNLDVYGTASSDPSTVAHCPSTGHFTVNPASFKNGEVNATAQFDETGVITLRVSEKPGHEFALVDADDTPPAQRYITPSTTITDPADISKDNLMVFIPYQITTTASATSTNGKSWLYMSNDVHTSSQNSVTPSMAAYVSYTIEAQNKAGNRVRNFTKTCFPDTDETNAPRRNGLKLNSTFDLFLDLWIKPNRNATLYFYTEDNRSNPIWVMTPKSLLIKDKNNTIKEWISPLQFDNGKGEAKVYFNIERNSSKPIDPISLTILDANTSTSWMSNTGATNIFNGSNINTTYTFYYARLHIPTQGIEGRQGDIKAYYEIYTTGSDPANIKGNESVDDINWYTNIAHTSTDGNIITANGAAIDAKINLLQKHSIINGEQNLTMNYSGSIFPYAKTFGLTTQSWLLFDKFDPTVSKARGRVIFNRAGGWLGKGDRNTSADSELAPPKNENSRILW